MAKKETEQSGEKAPRIVRGRVDSLSVYEITDYELEVLAQGTPSSTYFNFAIFLLSVAVSFLVTLLSTEIKSARLFAIFVIIVTVGLVAGAVLLVVWFRSKSSVRDIIKKIKKRMPPDPPSEEDAAP